MKKRIKNIMLVFACIISFGFCLTGCTGNNLLSSELTDLIFNAGNNFFNTHTQYDGTFEDTTFHWTSHMLDSYQTELEYKKSIEDEVTTKGAFTDTTETTIEYNIAFRKDEDEDTLFAKITVSKTIVVVEHVIDENDLLDTVSTTTVENSTYRLIPFTANGNAGYGLIYENSLKENEDDAVITKTYSNFSDDINYHNDRIENYPLKTVFKRIEETFLNWGIFELYYNLDFDMVKKGNRASLSSNTECAYKAGNSIVKAIVNTKVQFADNKIDKAEMKMQEIGEKFTYNTEVTFDYTNTANIDLVEGDVTSAQNGYEYTSNSPLYYIEEAPYIYVAFLGSN